MQLIEVKRLRELVAAWNVLHSLMITDQGGKVTWIRLGKYPFPVLVGNDRQRERIDRLTWGEHIHIERWIHKSIWFSHDLLANAV